MLQRGGGRLKIVHPEVTAGNHHLASSFSPVSTLGLDREFLKGEPFGATNTKGHIQIDPYVLRENFDQDKHCPILQLLDPLVHRSVPFRSTGSPHFYNYIQ